MKTTKLNNAPDEAQNEIAQAPPAQDSGTSPASAGGCLPRPCSALDEEIWDKIASNNSRNLEELLSTSKLLIDVRDNPIPCESLKEGLPINTLLSNMGYIK